MSVSPYAPQDIGFRYKKSSESSYNSATYAEGITSASGSFSIELLNLSPSTTYDVEAYVSVWTGSGYTELTRSYQFSTTATQNGVPTGSLELPAITGTEDLVLTMYKSGGTTGSISDRNYTVNYSKEYYSALWTAYTLTEADVIGGQSSSGNWSYNNAIFNGGYQVNVKSNSYGTNYGNDLYSRGHQIPNADRTSSSTANGQTYLLSNQTPQIQNKFNGSVWGSLETAARGFVVTNSSNQNYNSNFTKTDVLYVVTGPCYGKAGTSETPTVTLSATSSSISPSTVDVPLYYWKVLLKVKWDGDVVTDACAIGFWFEHKEYEKGTSYSSSTFVKSVDQIETWTGFDLFTNLPGTNAAGIEQTAEANTSWTTFQNF